MPPKKNMMKVISQAITNQIKWENNVTQATERAKCKKSKEKIKAKAKAPKTAPKAKAKMTISKKK